jgi:hypothetical protein
VAAGTAGTSSAFVAVDVVVDVDVDVGSLVEGGWGQVWVWVGRARGQEAALAGSRPRHLAAGRSRADLLWSRRGVGAHHDHRLVLLAGAPAGDLSCLPAGGVRHADGHRRGVGQSRET